MHGAQVVVVVTVTKAASLVNVGVKTMGFRKHLDYNTAHHNIYMAGVELHNDRNDGYIQWDIKQDLYRLKWLIDGILEDSPQFSDEEQFLKDHDKWLVWHKLEK